MQEHSTYVRARIDQNIKERANKALKTIGLSMSDAIRLLLAQIAEEQRFPFKVKFATPTTEEAIRELEKGRGQKVKSLPELAHSLHATD